MVPIISLYLCNETRVYYAPIDLSAERLTSATPWKLGLKLKFSLIGFAV